MASTLLSSITGSGGQFIPTFSSGLLLSQSSLTITPSSGERVRLNVMVATNPSTANYTITRGAITVIDDQILLSSTGANRATGAFYVGQVTVSDGDFKGTSIPEIVGDIGEVITITRESGAGVWEGNYEFGV